MLIVGSGAALACAFGPIWLVRLGLVPALAAAVISCLLAWREIDLERRAHVAAMLAVSRRHGEQLTQERRHTTTVLTAMTGRLESSATLATSRAATIDRLTGDITRLQGDVSGLRGANSRLTRDLNFRNLAITELRETVAVREAELLAVRTDADPEAASDRPEADIDAEVHRLPLRTMIESAAPGSETGVLDVDGPGRRTEGFLAAEVVAMPNYEEDRRFA